MTAPGAIFSDYLSGAAAAFFAGGDFRDPDARGRAVARVTRPLAPATADALAAQDARFTPSAARTAHLAALRHGAAAVVTGQQCGLFLGPLFTLYKAASAVAVARALAAETRQPVVPVFWLQTEDHDLPEIATCHVPRALGAPLALRLDAAPEARIAVAHCTLPDAVTARLAELRAEIGNLPHAEPHLARLERHYRPGVGWSEAFAQTLAELFADEGLVIVDPRDPALAAAAAPLHRRALTDAAALAAALDASSRVLAASGHRPAVHVRPGAPLSFFHPDGAEQARHRLEPAGEGFAEVGTGRTHPLATLLAALEADPRRFSTSALLRPILQDTLLPTAAYVAGPGEVAYFAQLAPLYAAYDVAMPLIVPRARLRIIEARTLDRCARLGITPADATRPLSELPARPASGTVLDEAELGRRLVLPFEAEMTALRAEIEHLGPGLDAAIDKTRASVAGAVAKLARKLDAARRHLDRDRADELQQLQWALAPDGAPQERVYGLAYFAARYGERPFLDRVLAEIVPFDPTPKDVVWSAPAPARPAAVARG